MFIELARELNLKAPLGAKCSVAQEWGCGTMSVGRIYKHFVPTGRFDFLKRRLHSGAGVAAGVAPGRVRASGRG